MRNATKRAQEMHFEYKHVTSFRGLRARHGPLQTQLLIVQYYIFLKIRPVVYDCTVNI